MKVIFLCQMLILKKPHGLLLTILCFLLFGVYADKVSDEDDPESILADVQYLYEEPKHYVDPNDMFVDFDGLRSAAKAQDDPKVAPINQVPLAARETSDAAAYRLDLDTCRLQRDLLQKELETQSSATEKFHKKLSREALVDYQPYYRRTLSLLWESLHLKSALRSVEHGSSTGVARQVTLVASAGAVTSLHRCLTDYDAAGGSLVPRQCDEAVSSLLAGVTVAPEQPGWAVRVWEAINGWTESVHTLNKLELALLVVAAVFMVLTGLLVRDVIRTRRMATSVTLLLVIAFVFCCLWNWRSMIKEVEARRAAEWEQRGPGSGRPPSECRDRGFWAWVVGADAACHRYYYEAFLSAAEEVSLEEVVSRTAAALFLGPLRIAGREIGHFFKEFYVAVPLGYLLPASVILVVLVVIIIIVVLLITCGYAVDFPLFMGGIRPGGPRNLPPPAINEEAITNRMREEQHQYLLESRRMMLEINAATIATAQRAQQIENMRHDGAVVQPILTSSFRSIESHLDQLISTRLHSMLEHGPAEASDRLTLGPPLTSSPRVLPLSFERPNSSAAQSSSTPAQHRKVPTACPSHSAGPEDCPDGGRCLLSAACLNTRSLDGGTGSCDVTAPLAQSPTVQEKSDFYHDVCNVLGESFTSSVGPLEELVSTNASNVTPPRVRQRVLKTELENDPPLSPASKKFLSEVQNALES